MNYRYSQCSGILVPAVYPPKGISHLTYSFLIQALTVSALLSSAELNFISGGTIVHDYILPIFYLLFSLFLILNFFFRAIKFCIPLLFILFILWNILSYFTHSTCGCFGKANVNPWKVFTLDILFILGWSLGSRKIIPLSRTQQLYIAVIVSTICAFIGIWRYENYLNYVEQKNTIATVSIDSNSIVLPNGITAPSFVLHGRWEVVVFRWDCSHCQELMPLWKNAGDP